MLDDRRAFLGWERSLLEEVAEWLLARKEALPRMVVLVPTAQAGRRLRERLAESGGVLAPRVMRPEGVLPGDEKVAGRAAELAAWVEVLEHVEDWSAYAGAFPSPPGVEEELRIHPGYYYRRYRYPSVGKFRNPGRYHKNWRPGRHVRMLECQFYSARGRLLPPNYL